MAQKNRSLFRGRISERKIRDLARLFAVDITADRAAELTVVNHKTAPAYFHLLLLRVAQLEREGCPFRGEVEVDESCFGPARAKGQPGRGAAKKTPVFGVLRRGGSVHCQIVAYCSKTRLQALIAGQAHVSASNTTEGFRSCDGPVEAGFPRHHRINKYDDPAHPKFAENGVHINGIESFRSYAKRRHQSFDGLRRASFRVPS